MQPSVWGKHFWYTIHFVTLGVDRELITPEQINDQMNFFENLHRVIPCYKCAAGYLKHLKERPLELSDMKDRRSLFCWTVDIHNMVNRELHKPQMSYDVAWKLYNDPDNFNGVIKNKKR